MHEWKWMSGFSKAKTFLIYNPLCIKVNIFKTLRHDVVNHPLVDDKYGIDDY